MHVVSGRPRSGFTLVELLVVIAVIGVLVALLLPAVQAAREASGRASCGNNLKQIGVGLHLYHDTYKCFPPNGYVRDPVSRRETNVSWMLSITPFIEQGNLYDQWWIHDRYDKDPDHNGATATDAPEGTNYWVAKQPIATYLCPSDGSNGDGVLTTQFGYGQFGHPVGVTNYKGNMGANWVLAPWSTLGSPFGSPAAPPWPASNGVFSIGVQSLRVTKIAGIQDGLSNTFLVGEAIPEHQFYNGWAAFFQSQTATCAVPLNASATCSKATSGNWNTDRIACRQTSPDTFTIGMSFASRHAGGGQFAIADGSTRFVPETIELNVYRGLGTCGLGEIVSIP